MCNSKSAESALTNANTLDVKQNSVNSTIIINYLENLKDHHETHFTDLKIGMGLLTVILLAFILWKLYKQLRKYDQNRIARLAASRNNIQG